MKEIDQPLKDKIRNLSDSELIKMAYIESIDYTDEAVQFAIFEVKRDNHGWGMGSNLYS